MYSSPFGLGWHCPRCDFYWRDEPNPYEPGLTLDRFLSDSDGLPTRFARRKALDDD